ncbi:universal stress protein [Haloarcula sp. H-GB4]|uniref:universal stress protein n=1 Tax=Haloarcula sp. H-GB4 TaxID=3069755 RepID=UPI00359C3C15
MQYAPDDILVHQTVTIGHDIAKRINNVAYQRDSVLVLLGWRGQRKRVSDYALGSNIDTVVENAECDVAVVKTDGTTDTKRVLVPTAGGANSDLAEMFAAAYTVAGAEVTLFHVATDGDFEAARSFSSTYSEDMLSSNWGSGLLAMNFSPHRGCLFCLDGIPNWPGYLFWHRLTHRACLPQQE